MIEFLATPIFTLANQAFPYIVTAAGSLAATWLALRAEKKSRATEVQIAVAAAESRTKQAREEYVGYLEREIKLLKERISESEEMVKTINTRVTVVEGAERVCQEERARLTLENSRLRHEIEELTKKGGPQLV